MGLPPLAVGAASPLPELSFMDCSLNPRSCAVFVKHTTIIGETTFLIGLERPQSNWLVGSSRFESSCARLNKFARLYQLGKLRCGSDLLNDLPCF